MRELLLVLLIFALAYTFADWYPIFEHFYFMVRYMA